MSDSAARIADILAATLVNELFNAIAVHSAANSVPIQKSFETYVIQLSENPDRFWRLLDQFQRKFAQWTPSYRVGTKEYFARYVLNVYVAADLLQTMSDSSVASVLRGAVIETMRALHSHVVHKALGAEITSENASLAQQLVLVTKGFAATALGNLTVRQSPIGGQQYVVSPQDQTVNDLKQKLVILGRAYKQTKAENERLRAENEQLRKGSRGGYQPPVPASLLTTPLAPSPALPAPTPAPLPAPSVSYSPSSSRVPDASESSSDEDTFGDLEDGGDAFELF